MENKILSRQELYDLVWAKPMVQLAKDFHLSDNGLRKICKKNDIPTPENGHWQKVQFGKKINKPALPPGQNKKPIQIIVDDVKKSFGRPTPNIKVIKERMSSNKTLILKVPSRLQNPDEIVIKTQANIEKRKSNTEYSQVKGCIETERGFPNISVTPKNIARVLRLLDCFIKNFRILGYNIQLKDEGLNITSDDDILIISFREKSNAIETVSQYGWKSRDLIPNGKLAIKIKRYGTIEFVDTDKHRLEDQIERILIKIASEFQSMSEMRALNKISQQKREEDRIVERAKEQVKQDELNNFIKFYNDAHRWKKYIILKEYFDFLSSRNLETNEKLDWMEEKLLWYNPSINKEDELLRGVDKDLLTRNKRYF